MRKFQFDRCPGSFIWHTSSFIGMAQHIKPLELPKFNGSAAQYTRWLQTFKRLVDDGPHTSNDYKLARLKEAVAGGPADDIISEMFDGPGAYTAAWMELERWYSGRIGTLPIKREREILNFPKIGLERDSEQLRKFAVKIRNVLVNLELSGESPGRELFLIALEKLPRSLIIRFYDRHADTECNITNLSSWLIERVVNVKRAVDVLGKPPTPPPKPIVKPQLKFHTTHFTASPSGEQCLKCRGPHPLVECHEFAVLGHWVRECKGPSCPTCGSRHHKLLHQSRQPRPVPDRRHQTNSREATHCQVDQTYHGMSKCSAMSFMTLPVVFFSPTKTAEVVAMLDPA